MASLAGLLKEQGYTVTGSDRNVYPPMDEFLAFLSIPVLEGYSPEHLSPPPDLVVVGNVVTRDNPEAFELARLELPYASLPQALLHFAMGDRINLVISGTHGKTTTSSLVAWILETAGLDPGFMIGGIPLNFNSGFKSGSPPYFVVEGDEYDTAFFDKGPKFVHYRPWAAILTGIEFDHADIYRDLDHVIGSFRRLVALIPEGGCLVVNADDPVVLDQIGDAKCRVETFGFGPRARWQAANIHTRGNFTHFDILRDGIRFQALHTPLFGRHNLANTLSAVVLSQCLELPLRDIARAVAGFKGVRRRLEQIGEKRGVLVLEDFAHHPTEVTETIAAVRERFEGRRLIAVFEPRSNTSRRNIFQNRYASAFDRADRVMVPEPPLTESIPPSERFSSRLLTETLEKNGIPASVFPGTAELAEAVLEQAGEGDVLLFMSNGAFDRLPRRVFERL